MKWKLWQAGEVEQQLDGITPLLASWEKSTHPAQIRLRNYLHDIVGRLKPLPDGIPLFLHIGIDVKDPLRLMRHYDLENYLTPLFGSRCLPAHKFYFVAATKYVGGGSCIAWGKAVPAISTDVTSWSSFSMNAGRGASNPLWKERIRNALDASAPETIPPGPACVRLAWRCASRRNWCSLWKPTGDAMGPVLGAADKEKPYHVFDDRIVDLEFHRIVDESLRNDVEVGMWWRAAVKERNSNMPFIVFQSDDAYRQWLESHPNGFVLNTTHPASPSYMVLHRASCTYISQPLHESAPGGFTERSYQKVGADDIESLRDWVIAHGRLDGTFSSECQRCKPTSAASER